MRDEGVLLRTSSRDCLPDELITRGKGMVGQRRQEARPLPLCFCKNPMTFSSTVVLSIFLVLPGSMELSSLIRTLNWSRRFFSDLFLEALEIHKAQVSRIFHPTKALSCNRGPFSLRACSTKSTRSKKVSHGGNVGHISELSNGARSMFC